MSSTFKKQTIPRALKEQVWLSRNGNVFCAKCPIIWCQNQITAFDHHTGHNIPESKGGQTVLENLFPICDRCNYSMGNKYNIDEWNKMGGSSIQYFTDLITTTKLKIQQLARDVEDYQSSIVRIQSPVIKKVEVEVKKPVVQPWKHSNYQGKNYQANYRGSQFKLLQQHRIKYLEK
jgi:hypothetical protein